MPKVTSPANVNYASPEEIHQVAEFRVRDAALAIPLYKQNRSANPPREYVSNHIIGGELRRARRSVLVTIPHHDKDPRPPGVDYGTAENIRERLDKEHASFSNRSKARHHLGLDSVYVLSALGVAQAWMRTQTLTGHLIAVKAAVSGVDGQTVIGRTLEHDGETRTETHPVEDLADENFKALERIIETADKNSSIYKFAVKQVYDTEVEQDEFALAVSLEHASFTMFAKQPSVSIAPEKAVARVTELLTDPDGDTTELMRIVSNPAVYSALRAPSPELDGAIDVVIKNPALQDYKTKVSRTWANIGAAPLGETSSLSALDQGDPKMLVAQYLSYLRPSVPSDAAKALDQKTPDPAASSSVTREQAASDETTQITQTAFDSIAAVSAMLEEATLNREISKIEEEFLKKRAVDRVEVLSKFGLAADRSQSFRPDDRTPYVDASKPVEVTPGLASAMYRAEAEFFASTTERANYSRVDHAFEMAINKNMAPDNVLAAAYQARAEFRRVAGDRQGEMQDRYSASALDRNLAPKNEARLSELGIDLVPPEVKAQAAASTPVGTVAGEDTPSERSESSQGWVVVGRTETPSGPPVQQGTSRQSTG